MPDRRVHRILTVLQQRWREQVRVEELAARVCLSPSRLEHVFKIEIGVSIRDYVRERRLVEAARLLRETDERVSVIGHEVGFHDPSNFSTAFRNRFGQSPRAYRSQHVDSLPIRTPIRIPRADAETGAEQNRPSKSDPDQ